MKDGRCPTPVAPNAPSGASSVSSEKPDNLKPKSNSHSLAPLFKAMEIWKKNVKLYGRGSEAKQKALEEVKRLPGVRSARYDDEDTSTLLVTTEDGRENKVQFESNGKDF